MSLIVNAILLNFLLLKMMVPLGNLNDQTSKQISKMIEIKDMLLALTRDSCILNQHPRRISHRFYQLAVMYYSHITKNLPTNERPEKI